MRFKLLSIALCLFVSLAATAANTKEQIAQVNESVQLSADIDYIITGTKPFTTTGSVDIVNTEHAVLIIANLKPSQSSTAGFQTFISTERKLLMVKTAK